MYRYRFNCRKHYRKNCTLIFYCLEIIRTQVKMKTSIIIGIVLIIVLIISSCGTGYTKKNGQWVWVTNDENFGSRNHWIEGIDNNSFKVLKQNKNFGADNHAVYFKGKKINYATPDGFTPLTNNEYGYAKDNYRVFLDNEVILKADPKTFIVLEFPYARDGEHIFNGNLPMNLNKNELDEFKVTNKDKYMKGTKSISLLSEFLKFNPDYQWIENLEDIEVKWVITGPGGTAETNTKKFIGLQEAK
ncbi:MAG: DKNYY domain-containing protein [Sphingobacteriales bacterium]|nr:DKNYY domain-containing protein [Sphingobacteriales bacterium]MBP9141516.1 DKNYY domain-containing protein [Chitinophagales bacterium]MBK7528294.1 DKNYY domain-containing protein [Sphingobacteriales bacterium]MBK8680252.1 DKNYY domain-containing protein [Sphingobacteriales bacterium]MBL0248066.1 DKNYY domain-containing protein [Sphingobacteriales bacterium]